MNTKLSGGKIALIVVGVIVLLLLIAVFSVVGTYNSLASESQNVEKSYSDIDTQLQRRVDLIPNLVNTVKGYTDHEAEVLQNVSDARAKLAGASTPADQAQADSELSSAISRLLVVVENYPDLKANENFIALQDELAGTENRIAYSRTTYNEAVQSFNAKIVSFPSNIIAGMFGFQQAEYYKASAAAQDAPEVNFN